MITNPSTLAGFMELLPEDQIVMNTMKNIIQRTYEKYGFLPLDTPVIEKSEVLLAKGGGDTEKQIYRFKKGTSDLSLRFDLTVPLARYVAQHFSELNFPFRRYQIGKVYRGERAQRGRFREFYQCDVDIIGNGKLNILNDAELPAIIHEIFTKFGFKDFVFHINNRKILNGFFRDLGIKKPSEVLRIIDKLDKIGEENVREELKEIFIEENVIEQLMNFIRIQGNNEEILAQLKEMPCQDEEFKAGVRDLEIVYHGILDFGVSAKYIALDLKIARGLDYYTGTVYETFLTGYESIGSVCSGGAYENLASNYTTQKLPGVGISIGLSRLYYQLNEVRLLKFPIENHLKALIVPMGTAESDCIILAQKLRQADIITQVYLEGGKTGKKFNYADKLNVPWVVVVGEEEINEGKYSLRNMENGEQEKLSLNELIEKLK